MVCWRILLTLWWWWVDVYLRRAELWLAMEVWQDMHVVKVDIYRSCVVLQHNRLYWILLYILRWRLFLIVSEYFSFSNEFLNITFFTKLKLSIIFSMRSSECLLSSRHRSFPYILFYFIISSFMRLLFWHIWRWPKKGPK